jgi:uncharacterized cupredoxin-like copper-binding protein
MVRRGAPTALVLASLMLAACAGGGGGAAGKPAGGGPQNVTVKGADTFKFDPATVSVRSGAPVHLTLDNTGALVHDWVVDDLDGKKVAVEAQPGRSVSADFTPTKPASYEFYCSQPGHREAGMKGTLTIS